MAYIGTEPLAGQNREVDDISSSFNGSTTAFTLQVSSVNVSPETANNIIVSLGGVIQNPGTDYTIAASTITFTTAPASGLDFFGLILGAGINTATVADDTIGPSKLIDTAVTAGSYTTADITVDAQGRITAAASGSIATAEIADQAVTNAKVNNSAAIAGTKISPDFGSQAISTTNDSVTIGDSIIHSGDTNTKIRFPAADTFSVETAGNERFRINSSGQVGIGTTSPTTNVQINQGDSDKSILQFTNSTTGSAAGDGFQIGLASDETALLNMKESAAMNFKTADTTRLSIASNGTKTIQNGNLNILSTYIDFSGSISAPSAAAAIFRPADNTLAISTANTERFRINSSGHVLVNCTSLPSTSVAGAGFERNGSQAILFSSSGSSTSSSNHAEFKNANGTVGTINTNGSATSYNTSSDYRLKENAAAISDGITRLKTLKPYRFNFIADATKNVDGFFAHEVTAVPEAITGVKDETKDILYTEQDTIPSGKKVGDVKETVPVYQGIDQSKLVPLLTAALQEAIAKVEVLETKVAALEAA